MPGAYAYTSGRVTRNTTQEEANPGSANQQGFFETVRRFFAKKETGKNTPTEGTSTEMSRK